jgi:hypothetical protein
MVGFVLCWMLSFLNTIATRLRAGKQWVIQKTKALIRRRKVKAPLPPEIVGRIVHFVGNRPDLLSLCLVSKTFHAESVRVLYQEVDLPLDNRLLYSWLKRVSSEAQLASWVTSLALKVDLDGLPTNATEEEEWYSQVGKYLGSLINLRRCVVACPFSLLFSPAEQTCFVRDGREFYG